MIVHTEGIVLKTFDLRETSRIACFFTKEFGKVSGVLKGIRTDPKKFRSSLTNFSLNDIVYYRYRNSDLHLVSQCDLKDFFFPIRQDLKRTLAASYMAELIYVVMPTEEENLEVYQLILDFLNSLQGEEDINQLVHMFQIKMLALSGFRPTLDACVKCKKTITAKVRFSLKDGGLVCPTCPAADPEEYWVTPGTVASILHVERNSWAACRRLKLTTNIKKELKYVLNNFLVFHLGRKLKSARFVLNNSTEKQPPVAVH
jgi:DNA repair protein RecO (recombination protein O)